MNTGPWWDRRPTADEILDALELGQLTLAQAYYPYYRALQGSPELTTLHLKRAANMARSLAEGRTASLHTNLAQGWVSL